MAASENQTDLSKQNVGIREKGCERACVRLLDVFVLTAPHFLILLRQSCQVFLKCFLFCRNQPLELLEKVLDEDELGAL